MIAARSALGDGGGAFQAGGPLTLHGVTIDGNSVSVSGTSGTAEGGGISGSFDPAGGPGPGQITLVSSAVTHNSVTGSPGLTLRGGGIFTTPQHPVTARSTTISGNSPDQCFGC